ncbi:McrC family protein [Marinoscillum pacificum]|uniref:McrC family protein n=1 Tax=Marinoscillum pacificum TaxID=392723 RepID=UPI0021588C91|nr:hypothetical protein [Marinoscillum pacificum]
MITLFEHSPYVSISDRVGLEKYLKNIWAEYKALWSDISDENEGSNYQPFFSFDGLTASARNYVGFVNFGNDFIEVYPKIFKHTTSIDKALMQRHLLYWLQICKKVKFPFNLNKLTGIDSDYFPEILIYLILKQFHDTLLSEPYWSYEEVNEQLYSPRGRINFNRYAKSVSIGQHYLIDCDHEPFVFNNKINRIIKYCTKLLAQKTSISENLNLASEIDHLLDEVDSIRFTSADLENIHLSVMFDSYNDILDTCRFILLNQSYSSDQNDLSTWSLLLPMEIIFEDFIARFIEKKFSSDYEVQIQKSDLYLHNNPRTFNIQHDILLINRETGKKLIIDTKYKPRWNSLELDNKKGVSQSDMYQMISYAYRRGVQNVLLIYPNSSSQLHDDFTFVVPRETNPDDKINISLIDIPFWSLDGPETIDNPLYKKLRYSFSKLTSQISN